MKFVSLLYVLLFSYPVFGQNSYPKNYFIAPVENKLTVSSNFGKIRANHFHAGLDINTKLKSGINILASADGYISRVNISPGGYGKAIYITHPNGFVTVYAHLSEIKKNVADLVYQLQHQRKSFKVDINFLKDQFPVKKGEIIGKSGNSGRSFGAHLHFEIREEVSEKLLNPLLFGFNVPDNEAPEINAVYFYNFINFNGNPHLIDRMEMSVNNGDTLSSFDLKGIGLELRDYLSGKKGNFDVYQLKLSVDDSVIFHYRFNSFAFDEALYINSFIDYGEFVRTGKKIVKCYIEPNNKLSIYKSTNNGLFDVSNGKVRKINISASDIKGNSVKLGFYIKSDSSAAIIPDPKSLTVKKINCKKTEEFSTDSFRIVFNDNCLFDNLDFKYHVSNSLASAYSKYHYIHNPYVPLYNEASIEIKPVFMPENLKPKCLIVGVGKRGSLFSAGGKWSNGYVKAEINSLGTYYIAVDTIPPSIRLNVLKKSKNDKTKFLNFIIKDELSGIKEYVAFIDDKWVLFEYDEKNSLISCNLKKENIKEGKHHIIIWVRDKCNNLNFYESEFVIQ